MNLANTPQGEIEYERHEIANINARDHAPEQIRSLTDEHGPGTHPVNQEHRPWNEANLRYFFLQLLRLCLKIVPRFMLTCYSFP